MPLKLSVSLSRKVGEANYGSRGATVGLEMEAEIGLVHQPEQLGEQVAHLFRLARESVERELAQLPAAAGNVAVPNGRPSGQNRLGRSATPPQVRAIQAIAGQLQLDLGAELRNRFGVNYPEALSLVEASQLIDALKASSPPENSSIAKQIAQ
jgi:hypothetical protein